MYKSQDVFQNIKHDSTKSPCMQYSVSSSSLCPSLSLTSRDQARYIIDRLLAKQSYLKRCRLYWQDSSYTSPAVLGNSTDFMSHLFLPEAKFMGGYCLQQFVQLQLFCFCCLRVQNVLNVLLCLLVTPNFMFAVFAAWSTLNFICPVCVPCKRTDFRIPWSSLLQDTAFQMMCSYFLSCCDFQGPYFCLLHTTLILNCLAPVS